MEENGKKISQKTGGSLVDIAKSKGSQQTQSNSGLTAEQQNLKDWTKNKLQEQGILPGINQGTQTATTTTTLPGITKLQNLQESNKIQFGSNAKSNIILPGISEPKYPNATLSQATQETEKEGNKRAKDNVKDTRSMNEEIHDEMVKGEYIPLLKQGAKQTWNDIKKFGYRKGIEIVDDLANRPYETILGGIPHYKLLGKYLDNNITNNLDTKPLVDKSMNVLWNKYYKYEDKINKNFDKWVDQNMNKIIAKEYQDSGGVWESIKSGNTGMIKYGLMQGFSTSVIPMIPGIVAGVITKNPAVTASIAFASTAPIEDQEAYEEAMKEGATRDEATQIGRYAGIINGTLETIGEFLQLKGLLKPLKKNITKEITKKTTRQIISRGLLERNKGVFGEALTEGTQEFVTNALIKTINENKDIFEGVIDSMIVGGVLGGGGSTLGAGGKVIEDVENNKKIDLATDIEALNYVMQGEERKAQRMQQKQAEQREKIKQKILSRRKANTWGEVEEMDNKFQKTEEENAGFSSRNEYSEGRNIGWEKDENLSTNSMYVSDTTTSENSSHGDRMTTDSFFETDENGDYIEYDDGSRKERIYAGGNKTNKNGSIKSQFTEKSKGTPRTPKLKKYYNNFYRLVKNLSNPNVKVNDYVQIGKTGKGKNIYISKGVLAHIIEDHGVFDVNTLIESVNNPTGQKWESETTKTRQGGHGTRPYMEYDIGSEDSEIIVGIKPDSWEKDTDTAEYYGVVSMRESNAPTTPADNVKFQLKYEEKGYTPGVANKKEKDISGKEGIKQKNTINDETIEQLAEKYGVKVEVIKGMIEILKKGKGGIIIKDGEAYGKYRDQLLTLSEQIKESTAPHELLHAIFDMIDPETKTYLIAQVMKSEGWNAETAEERLADSFSNFFRTGKIEGAPKSTWGRIKIFFKRVRSFINGMNKWRNELDEIFTDIITADGIVDLQSKIDESSSLNKSKERMRKRFMEYRKNAIKTQERAESESKYQKAGDINSPAFKKRFGDSKVVDKDGNPLVVYHGTRNGGFTSFNKNDSGIRFSEDIDVADSYAGDDNRWTRAEIIKGDKLKDDFNYEGDEGIYKVYLSIKNPLVLDYEGYGATNHPELSAPSYYLENLSDEYDGVIARNIRDEGGWNGGVNDPEERYAENTVYGVKNPNQVKSATDNVGTYDENNDDIRYQKMDDEYAEAVENGNTTRAKAILREYAKEKGYNSSTDYQGSLAFNGSAPASDGLTKEERVSGNEDIYSQTLGDFASDGLDWWDLGRQLDPNGGLGIARSRASRGVAGGVYDLESINNLRNAVMEYKKGNKDVKIRMYRAIDSDIKEEKFRNGDWITPSKEYAKHHIDLQDWKKGRVISEDVSIEDIRWDGNDINERGFDNEKEYGYKDTPNNRKELEITYDDNGNLIPLSERFNENVEDERYQRADDKLINLHNLSMENLRKSKRLGGFPMPSIAITKEGVPHTSYGDISVIFKKDTVDPSKNKANKLFGVDAYTPTVPRIVAIPKNTKEADKIIDKIQDETGLSYGEVLQWIEYKEDYERYYPELLKYSDLHDNVADYKIFDGYTPAGKRRYLDYNLENLVKKMKKTDTLGAFGNFGNLVGAEKGKVKSIEDVRAMNFAPTNLEEYRELSKEYSDNLREFYNNVIRGDSPLGYDMFSRLVESTYNKDDNKRLNKLNEEVFEQFLKRRITLDDVKKIHNPIKRGAEIVRPYAEAKPERAVGFDEVGAIVVPNEQLEEARELMKDTGVDVYGYAEGERMNVIDAVADDNGLKYQKAGDTNSEAFKKRFGNSIDVDENGNPKELYHGTTEGGWDIFDRSKVGRNAQELGPGFYFTNDYNTAKEYTYNMDKITGKTKKGNNPEIKKVYVSIQNPLVWNKEMIDLGAIKKVFMDGNNGYFFESTIPFKTNGKEIDGKVRTKEEVEKLSKSEKVDLMIKALMYGHNKQDYEGINKNLLNEIPLAYELDNRGDVLDKLKKYTGKDGVYYKNWRGLEQYVTWSEGQAKYSDNNVGTYDMDNPDMKFQKAGNTKSANFKKRFDGSKVVKENGKPQIVYHGTTAEFTVFNKIASRGIFGDGYYFTNKLGTARNYGYGRDGRVMKVYLAIKNPYVADNGDGYFLNTEKLKEEGYDGVQAIMGSETYWVAFDSNQIKSATDNVGTYDPNNDDIRYQITEYEYDENGNRKWIKFGDNSEFDPSIFGENTKEEQIEEDKENEKSNPFYNAWMKYNNQNYKDDQLTLGEFVDAVGAWGEKKQEEFDKRKNDIAEVENDPKMLELQLKAVKLVEEETNVGKKFGKNVSKEVRDRQQAEVEKKREDLAKEIYEWMYPGLRFEEATYDDTNSAWNKEAEWEMLGREKIEEKLRYFKKDSNGNWEKKNIKLETPQEQREKIEKSGNFDEVIAPSDRVIEWKTPEGQKGRLDKAKDPKQFKKVMEKINSGKSKTKVELKDVTNEVRALERYKENEKAEKERRKKEKQEEYAKKKQEEYKRNVRLKAFQRLVDMQRFEKYPFLSEDEIKQRWGFTDEEWKKITEQLDLGYPPKKRNEKAVSDFNKAVDSEVKFIIEGLSRQNNMKQKEAEKNLGEIGEIDLDVLLSKDEEKGQKEVEEFERIAKEEKKKEREKDKIEEGKTEFEKEMDRKTRKQKEQAEKLTKQWNNMFRKAEEKRNERYANKEEKKIDEVKSLEEAKAITKENWWTKTKKFWKDTTIQDLIQPISSRIEKISPRVYLEMMRFEQRIAIKQNTRIKQVEDFVKVMGEIRRKNKKDYLNITLHLLNGNVGTANKMLEKYNTSIPRKVLDEIWADAEDVGYTMNYEGFYYPRKVKDVKDFLNWFAKIEDKNVQGEIDKIIRKKEKQAQKRGEEFTPQQKADLINQLLMDGEVEGISLGSGHMKKRKVDSITKNMLEFYEDPVDALLQYISGMTEAIEKARFLGQGTKGEIKTLGEFIADEGISGYDADELRKLLLSRFNYAPMGEMMSKMKVSANIIHLGSPSSALSQLADISFSLIENGITNLVQGLSNKYNIDLDALGITNRGEELKAQGKNETGWEKVQRFTFKRTGFNMMDQFGKKSFVVSTLNKLIKYAKNDDPQLRKDLSRRFDDPKMINEIIEDLKEGRMSENVNLFLFTKLADVQPLTRTQMTRTYLQAGNWRVLYAFKTFGIKQLDYIIQKSKRELATKPTAKALWTITAMLGIIMLCGAGTDEIKDFSMGRKYNSWIWRMINGDDWSVSQLSDRFWDNFLKLLGFTKYSIYQARTQGVKSAVEDIFFSLPGLDLFTYPMQDIQDAMSEDGLDFSQASSWQLIPIVGKYGYWWAGAGQTKQQKSLDKEKNKNKKGSKKKGKVKL